MNYINNYIIPELEDIKLDKLTTIQIQKFYNDLQKNGRVQRYQHIQLKNKGLSVRVVHGIHTLLNNCLEQAVAERLILVNPARGCKLPKMEKREMKVLPEEKIRPYLMEADKRGLLAPFYLELTTGLRRGEICGLKWEDFDAENGKLKVRRSVAKRKGGGLNIGETKTETGTRTIVLPPSTAELLRKRKETAVSEWIFPNIYEPEKPMHPDYAYHRLKTLLKQAELPLIRFHDLRHTFATHALAGGVDAKTLSGILGHTNASFTLDTYTHVTTDMQKNASNIVGSFMDEIMLEGDDTNR